MVASFAGTRALLCARANLEFSSCKMLRVSERGRKKESTNSGARRNWSSGARPLCLQRALYKQTTWLSRRACVSERRLGNFWKLESAKVGRASERTREPRMGSEGEEGERERNCFRWRQTAFGAAANYYDQSKFIHVRGREKKCTRVTARVAPSSFAHPHSHSTPPSPSPLWPTEWTGPRANGLYRIRKLEPLVAPARRRRRAIS